MAIFFVGPNGTPYKYPDWCSRFKDIITVCKVKSEEKKHVPHSLRKTGATLYYLCGLKEQQIKILGRWKSIAWLTYVKPDPLSAALSSSVLLNKYLNKN